MCDFKVHFENHAFKKKDCYGIRFVCVCVCGIVVGINMIAHDMYYYHSLKFVKALRGH
jgi:hypothetical protein